jgi:hypothetical protein
MLVASDDATSGSVIKKLERISPFSNGTSHVFFCCSVPNLGETPDLHMKREEKPTGRQTYSSKTSMFPVSGAELLQASGATAIAWLIISQRGAYSVSVNPWPLQNLTQNHKHSEPFATCNRNKAAPRCTRRNQMVVFLCDPKVPQTKLPAHVETGDTSPKTREKAKQQDGLGSKFEFLQHARHGAPAVSGRPHLLVEYVFTRNTLLLHKPPQLHGQIGEFGRHGTSFGAFCCWYGDDLTHSSPSHLVSFEMNRTTTTPPTFDMSRRTSGTR